MADNCDHNCSSCGENCPSRMAGPEDLRAPANKRSSVKKVIGVVSGKGGVGKSLVTSLLAVAAAGTGLKAGILDADITGPSIPHAFGITEKAMSDGVAIFPVTSQSGIEVMSINLVLENEKDPVLWRGALIASAVRQFWTDVAWGDLDYLFVDMPPGTGDVPLTVFQSLPVDGIVIVTSPQDLVSMVVEKALRMAEKMNIPVLGLVENMSYVTCPDCGSRIRVFGNGHIDEITSEHGIKKVAELPIDPQIAYLVDEGLIEEAPAYIIEEILPLLKDEAK